MPCFLLKGLQAFVLVGFLQEKIRGIEEVGTYYVTKESQEIAGCRLIRYGIGCRWREILGLSHNRQAVEWLVERCNTLELDPIHLEDVVQDFLWEQGEPMRTIAG